MPGNAGRKKSRNHTGRWVSMVLFFSLSLTSCTATATSSATVAEITSAVVTTDNTEPATTKAKDETTQGTTEAAPQNLFPEESAAVSDDYFDDAVFIGNSITDTFAMFCGLENTAFYAATNLTVRSAYTKPVVKVGDDKIPVMDAVKQHTFKKVYIMFGLNELGWSTTSVFIEEYGKLIDDVKKAQPEAVIYVQSILPVSAKKSQKDEFENNENILKFNRFVEDIAKDKQVYYLNVHDSLIDESGCLPDEASVDGLHFNKKYCLKWLDYLKTHTAEA